MESTKIQTVVFLCEVSHLDGQRDLGEDTYTVAESWHGGKSQVTSITEDNNGDVYVWVNEYLKIKIKCHTVHRIIYKE